MVKFDSSVRETFASNLRYLLNRFDMSQSQLARKASTSQKSISNILNPDLNQVPSIETADRIAQAFGLPGWYLSVPGLPRSLLFSNAIPKLIERYIDSSEEARRFIDSVVERESQREQS